MIIVLGGLSGTGKSTIAAALPKAYPRQTVCWLRTDAIRKELAGVAADELLPPAAYTAAQSAIVYATLYERIAAATDDIIIADGVFLKVAERKAVQRLAPPPHKVYGFWLFAPVTVVEQRLAKRQGDISDATVEVYRRQLQQVKTESISWPKINTAGPVTNSVAAITTFIEEDTNR